MYGGARERHSLITPADTGDLPQIILISRHIRKGFPQLCRNLIHVFHKRHVDPVNKGKLRGFL